MHDPQDIVPWKKAAGMQNSMNLLCSFWIAAVGYSGDS